MRFNPIETPTSFSKWLVFAGIACVAGLASGVLLATAIFTLFA
jgi:hypothetical protein